MEQDKAFLGKEPIGKLLLKLALPTVAAQMINMLYNLVDRIYIGHIPNVGVSALAGVGVCMPLIMLVSAFAALVGYGGSPRVSIYMGKKDNETAEKILGNCFAMQIIISAILTAVLLIWSRDLLMLFGASRKSIEYAVSYMNIYAVGTIFVELTLGMNAFITAQGFAKTGMLSVLIGAISNIILDPIFIFGFGMGVKGAALATIISQGLSCIWVISFLMGRKTMLTIRSFRWLALFRIHFHPEGNLLTEIFPGEKNPLMSYIIRKALFINAKLHGRAIDGDNASLGVSRALVIDGKALQDNILAVLEVKSQKLRMKNEVTVFSSYCQMSTVRKIEGDPLDGILIMVGNA